MIRTIQKQWVWFECLSLVTIHFQETSYTWREFTVGAVSWSTNLDIGKSVDCSVTIVADRRYPLFFSAFIFILLILYKAPSWHKLQVTHVHRRNQQLAAFRKPTGKRFQARRGYAEYRITSYRMYFFFLSSYNGYDMNASQFFESAFKIRNVFALLQSCCRQSIIIFRSSRGELLLSNSPNL